ncbi:MAG: hypothetical protein IJK67_04945 [Bacilli bacterium]|nr:hypothetical protein [Bacilli bacterium]
MKTKNILIILLVSLIMLFPVKSLAKTYYDGYDTKNLKETLEAEDMKLENTDYKETSKQAIVYLFRGQGCGYCRNFITFLNSISKDYGKYFKLVSFEVWNDSKNNELMQKVASTTGQAAGGVPYIVIGEKVFPGYISDWDEDIKTAIKNQYDDNSYDVFEEIEKAEKAAKKAASGGSSTASIIGIIVTVLCTAVIIFVQCKNTKKVLDAMNNKPTSPEPVKEEKKPVVVKKSRKK